MDTTLFLGNHRHDSKPHTNHRRFSCDGVSSMSLLPSLYHRIGFNKRNIPSIIVDIKLNSWELREEQGSTEQASQPIKRLGRQQTQLGFSICPTFYSRVSCCAACDRQRAESRPTTARPPDQPGPQQQSLVVASRQSAPVHNRADTPGRG